MLNYKYYQGVLYFISSDLNKSTFRLITIVRSREYYDSRGDSYGINNRSKRFKKVL